MAEETVYDIRINYSHDQFHSIESEHFGAYWVGTIELPEDEIRSIVIGQSWAKTRLIIDGHVVYDGRSDKEFPLALDKGDHLVEVEFTNNWHTTKFLVSLDNNLEKLSIDQIISRLEGGISGQYSFNFAGVYRSSSKDMAVVLNIDKLSKPIVLVLSSYEAINWRISNPYMTEIRAVVYASYSPCTTISGDLSSSTLLLPSRRRIGSHGGKPSCTCEAGSLFCDTTTLLWIRKAVEQLGESKMTGYSGEYSAASLFVPQFNVEEVLRIREKTMIENASSQNTPCSQNHVPHF